MNSLLRAPVLALVLAVLAASVGCTYLKEMIGLGPQRPKVTVTDVAVRRASLQKLDLEVTLRVDNPNGFDIDFSKLRYAMTSEALEIASGTYDAPVTIPEKGRTQIKLPLSIDARAALKLLKELLTREDEIYATLTATAEFKTPFGGMDVELSDRRPLKKLAGF